MTSQRPVYTRKTSVGRKTVALSLLAALVLLTALASGALVGLIKVRDQNRVYLIPSASNEPAINVGEQVLTSKLSSDDSIERGWFVVFAAPAQMNDSNVEVLVKRVVGLPGETIESRDGKVFVNGAVLDESYLAPGVVTAALQKTVIPANSYYVMGDNRVDSFDSRRFGSISRESITRHVTRVISPFENRRTLP